MLKENDKGFYNQEGFVSVDPTEEGGDRSEKLAGAVDALSARTKGSIETAFEGMEYATEFQGVLKDSIDLHNRHFDLSMSYGKINLAMLEMVTIEADTDLLWFQKSIANRKKTTIGFLNNALAMLSFRPSEKSIG